MRTPRKSVFLLSAFVAMFFAVVSPISPSAMASTSVSYDFDTAGDLAAAFNSYVPAGYSASQSASGGISNSGAIAATPNANTNAVFASKASYSMGPVGSTYTFSSYMQSIGGNGYSGMGFTSLVPSSSTASGTPFRPTDALGISVHGGGFVFHNGATDFNGNWDGSATDPAITPTSPAPYITIIGNSSNAPDRWYKIVLVITRDSATTFDMQVQVWPANVDGTLRTGSALAVFELNDQAQPSLIAAPSINTYINFSGDRVYYFDNYQVSLAGGSSVIAAGAPVVLTTQAVQASNVVTFDGAVTGTGGATVTERGFVYGTSANPTISDTKVPVGSGIGSFQGLTSTLPNGTYFFRAYATNSSGTSYGVEEQLTLASVVSAPSTPAPSATATPAATSLASTGLTSGNTVMWGIAFILSGAAVMAFRKIHKPEQR